MSHCNLRQCETILGYFPESCEVISSNHIDVSAISKELFAWITARY